MLKVLFDQISLLSLSKKNAVLGQNPSKNMKRSKYCDRNVDICPEGYRMKKTHQTFKLLEAATENYGDIIY